MTYLLSDFRGLWQAMQFSTRIGATSRKKLTGFVGEPASGWTGCDAAGFDAEGSALICDRLESDFLGARGAFPLSVDDPWAACGFFWA
jgi:hypothetical protein